MSNTDIKIELAFNNFPAISEEMARKMDEICETYAYHVLAASRLAVMQPPKTGRVYKHGNVEHQASAPGEAPATDTGALVNNSGVERKDPGDYEVWYAQEYAAALEYGTPTIEPRPYLRPAVEDSRNDFTAAMERVIP